ncbi:MAG: hypothetical protein JWQ43_807 [Glaciihabitans sp.]|nr:hypothetical protein [Glaciihabitans sp.]
MCVSALSVLSYPARRDVKSLGTILGEIDAPSAVSATFVEDRYGTFVVVGDAVLSASAGTLTLAGRFIEQGMKPDRTLRVLTPVTEDNPASVPPAADTDSLREGVASLAHGDLVQAGLFVRAYGSFTITGMAVWSEVANAFLIGGWFIDTDGAPSPRLESLSVLATAAEHGGPVPPRITAALIDDIAI